MIGWTSEKVSEALGVAIPEGRICSSIVTDTRLLSPGAVFVALGGKRFDGHNFLGTAAEKGATVAVVAEGTAEVEGLHLVHVADTRDAYGRLARYARRAFGGPVVAITGSNGKTSTKEIVAAALASKWTVHATSGNNNNLVGVPLTILAAPPGTEALVVEVGASEPGEVAKLRDVVEPDLAIVTNVSAAHISGFGSLDGVVTEKVALTRDVPVAMVGVNPRGLSAAVKDAARVVTVGLKDADVVPDRCDLVEGRPVIEFGGVTVELPVYGMHQAENAMFALAASQHFGLDLAAVAQRMEHLVLPGGRTEMLKCGSVEVVNDAYNANPASLSAALRTVRAIRGERRLVLILGSMLELGDNSQRAHSDGLAEAIAIEPSVLVAVGEFAKAARNASFGGHLILAEDADEAGCRVSEIISDDDLVLLKGSRGVRLEKVLEYLKMGN